VQRKCAVRADGDATQDSQNIDDINGVSSRLHVTPVRGDRAFRAGRSNRPAEIHARSAVIYDYTF